MVHNVVVDMAVDNADLVDINFTIDYLKAISPYQMQKRIDSDKTNALVKMFREKCGEASTISYINDFMNKTENAIVVASRFEVPELDEALISKWTQGKKVGDSFLLHYMKCRQAIKNNKDWSDAQEKEFCEKTLQHIELREELRKGRPPQFISSRLQYCAILESLPESEKRNELLNKVIDSLNGISITSVKVQKEILEAVSLSLLQSNAEIGVRTREVTFKIVDNALGDLQKEENMKRIKHELLPLISTILATGFTDRAD